MKCCRAVCTTAVLGEVKYKEYDEKWSCPNMTGDLRAQHNCLVV